LKFPNKRFKVNLLFAIIFETSIKLNEWLPQASELSINQTIYYLFLLIAALLQLLCIPALLQVIITTFKRSELSVRWHLMLCMCVCVCVGWWWENNNVCVCVSVSMFMYVYGCVWVCVCAFVCVCVGVCIWMCACAFVCSVCVCVRGWELEVQF